MADQSDRLGSSGVFKAIADSARKFKRAVTGADDVELTPVAHELGDTIARAFVAGRFADVHALGTTTFQQRNARDQFVARWLDAAQARGPFTSFAVANAGTIDLGFIPGLEEVAQEQFAAFIEITFSSPTIPLDDDKAFAVAVVLLNEGSDVRLGAVHAR
jgi:hypothetical protein